MTKPPPNLSAAGKRGIHSLFHAGRACPALPERHRYRIPENFLARPVSPSYHIGEGKNQTPESGETTMAFNANLPQANSPISSAELRDQFNALKALIDQRPTMAEVTSSTASNC